MTTQKKVMVAMPYSCPVRQLAYQRQWMSERRRKFVAELGACAGCGSTSGLEIHHTDPSVKTSHRIWSWSPTRLRAELAKCQVLCGDCHMEETREFLREKSLTQKRVNGRFA